MSILPEYLNLVGYVIITLPTKGKLFLNEKVLKVGDIFTQLDINNNSIKYKHTGLVSLLEDDTDFFEFKIYDRSFLVEDNLSYSSCMPERNIETPINGVFRFDINIRSNPFPEGIISLFSLEENEYKIINSSFLNFLCEDSQNYEIRYEVLSSLTHIKILINNKEVKYFTQADIDSNNIVIYGNSSGSEIIKFRICSKKSKCVEINFNVNILPIIKQIGPNVFYGKINSKWSKLLQTNLDRSNILWQLIDGTYDLPLGAKPNPIYLNPNTVFLEGCNSNEECGKGWNKLPEYRNLNSNRQWNGGLPEGVSLSTDTGLLYVETQNGFSNDENIWFLPNKPQTYQFVIRAIDMTTGKYVDRKYYLHITNSGFSKSGKSEEQID